MDELNPFVYYAAYSGLLGSGVGALSGMLTRSLERHTALAFNERLVCVYGTAGAIPALASNPSLEGVVTAAATGGIGALVARGIYRSYD